MLAAAGRDSPRRATSFLAARQERRQRNVPCSQRPRKLRVANLSGQPAVAANTCVRHNSLRAEALHSNRCRKSEHEVWLSFGSQTAGIYSDRRRWLKGVGRPTANSQQPTACESCAAGLDGPGRRVDGTRLFLRACTWPAIKKASPQTRFGGMGDRPVAGFTPR